MGDQHSCLIFKSAHNTFMKDMLTHMGIHRAQGIIQQVNISISVNIYIYLYVLKIKGLNALDSRRVYIRIHAYTYIFIYIYVYMYIHKYINIPIDSSGQGDSRFLTPRKIDTTLTYRSIYI
jgi:hypothetical protein